MIWSTAVFGASLLGLITLFGLKSLELTRDTKTPLHHIRRIGDPILTEGWAHYRARGRKLAFTGLRIGIIWLRTAIHKTIATFDSIVHALASHLNRYLRTRRLHIRHGSGVSTHLKTVLEKTEQKAEESDPL